EAGDAADAELDGGTGANVFGAVEDIRHAGADRFLLKGWMVDDQGAVPSALALELDGYRHAARILRRVPRPDVQRHFGLTDPVCGFEAEVDVAGAGGVADLAGAQVLGGATREQTEAPLRMSAAVRAQLAGTPAPAGQETA